jgi:hypothetical protein
VDGDWMGLKSKKSEVSWGAEKQCLMGLRYVSVFVCCLLDWSAAKYNQAKDLQLMQRDP